MGIKSWENRENIYEYICMYIKQKKITPFNQPMINNARTQYMKYNEISSAPTQ